jgi:hypothetical protein
MALEKNISGFENIYSIDTFGRVQSLKRGRLVKINYATPYPSIHLSKKGHKKSFNIHRLLAIHFLKNPENKKTVNHKNGIKTDFRIENLEWATYSENSLHAYKTGLSKVSDKNKKAVSEKTSGANHYNSKQVLNKITGEVYPTIRDAAKKNGYKVQTLHRHLHQDINLFLTIIN